MATFNVTKDTVIPVVTPNRDVDVLFDVTTVTFSIYVNTIRGGVSVAGQKVRFGASATIHFLKGDSVEVTAVGTGTINVTIL